MAKHTTGCVVCGKPLVYFDTNQELPCAVCGHAFETDAACENGHYVCDACHARSGQDAITKCALSATSANPFEIAVQMMDSGFVNMHGPEHHYLIVAALLAAYQNAGAELDLGSSLRKALQRTKNIPGGICGLWGSCGAAIGTGVFVSIITGASPLAEESWGQANFMTSQSLAAIASHGGPRCCKRDVWTAMEEAVAFAKERFGVEMEPSPKPVCTFFPQNKECLKEHCPYHPAG